MKVKDGMLIFGENEIKAIMVNLFRGYTRFYGGEIQKFDESYKFFKEKLMERKQFQKLPEVAQHRLIMFIMDEFRKGFESD